MPKHIWEGGCENWSQIPSSHRNKLYGKYDIKSCNYECNKLDWCDAFFLGKGPKAGICFPYAKGCTKATDPNVDYFEKLDLTNMNKVSSADPDGPIKFQYEKVSCESSLPEVSSKDSNGIILVILAFIVLILIAAVWALMSKLKRMERSQ